MVTHYASGAGPDGSAATGIDGISILGDWRLFGVVTESAEGLARFKLPPEASAQLGRLIEATPGGPTKTIADVGDFDYQWSNVNKSKVPEQFPDANPYGVLAVDGKEYVVDAASNTLDEVRSDGSIKFLAFFPNPPKSDAVPTCVARGPDGALYVGELTGGGNEPGASTVWRVVPGQDPTPWATGLTAVTGCGFDGDGDFYAVEFSTLGFESFKPETGALVRVPAHSTSPVTVASKLSFPNGFAASGDAIYTSTWSIAPAENHGGPTGQVVRIDVGGEQEGGGDRRQQGEQHSSHHEGVHGQASRREASKRSRRR